MVVSNLKSVLTHYHSEACTRRSSSTRDSFYLKLHSVDQSNVSVIICTFSMQVTEVQTASWMIGKHKNGKWYAALSSLKQIKMITPHRNAI